MGRDTCFALVSASGVCGPWRVYNGAPMLTHVFSTSLPRTFFDDLDVPLSTYGREISVEELREWVKKLPAYHPPDSLLGLFEQLDDFEGMLSDELAVRLFLEYLIALAEKEGAPWVSIRRE